MIKLFQVIVSHSNISFLAVEYRLAPEVKNETPALDVFSALNWLHKQVNKLNVDPNRIAIMGDSADGGIAAGVAILARNHGVFLKQQILIYPMLDDRNTKINSNILLIMIFFNSEDELFSIFQFGCSYFLHLN